MSKFNTHTKQTAPSDALPIFESAQKKWGLVANILGKMAEAPALVKGYWALAEIFENTTLTPTQQQIVLITTSVENQCSYCVGAHSAMADMLSVPTEITDAIRQQEIVADAQLEALHSFTRQVVEQRGLVAEESVNAFLNAGYTRTQLLEVILGVGFKTLSNYANHLMETELDSVFASRSWVAAH